LSTPARPRVHPVTFHRPIRADGARGARAAAGEASVEGAGPPSASAGAPPGWSLGRKALAVFLGLVAYLCVAGILLGRERDVLLQTVNELEQLHARDELLTRVSAALAHATLEVNEAYFSSGDAVAWGDVVLGAEAVQAGLYATSRFTEDLVPFAVTMQPMLSSLLKDHSRPTLIDLRATLREVERTVDGVVGALRDRKQALSTQYRVRFDTLTLKAAAFALLGLTAFGSMMTFFFARMAWDIRRLERRAIRIVDGYRGPALQVTRGDELGALMASVNTMQSELRAREARLELGRQEQLHKEKMAAIGALAAGIAHEINNPIAAIAGVAEEIELTRAERGCPHHGAACRPDLILEHTRRVATITRQISHFSTPGAAHAEPIDLNSLVRNTCSFIQYDRRFQGLRLDAELDPNVPAIEAVADPLTQVLMNLLVNAADACESNAPGTSRVGVRTLATGGHVLMIVEDNGCGMDQRTLSLAFDEYFTTKSPGRGSGLGLALCRRLLDPLGATLALESSPGEGTRATVRLPVPGANPTLN